MLTVEDLRNPTRKSGFNHVNTAFDERPGRSNPHPYQAKKNHGGGHNPSYPKFIGPRRATAEEAAQDYCDYINGSGVTPAKQLRSAGHTAKRAPRAVDDEAYEGALGVIRDVEAQRAGRQGYVYCISDGEFVKIGYSTNPQARVSELQTGNARPLRLAYYFAGTLQDEADLHQKYIEDNVLQEWFRPSVELVLDFYHRKAATS